MFRNFLSKKVFYGVITIVIIVICVFIFNNTKIEDQIIVINHSNFINQVSISGKVIPLEDVSLGFKNGGIIKNIYFPVGEKVIKAGTLIANIDSKNLEESIHDAEISLESSKLSLEKLKIQNSNDNMNADLLKAYDDGFSTVSNTFLDLPNIVTGLEDILAQENLSDNRARMVSKIAQDYRSSAETKYYTAKNSFDESRIFYRTLNRNSPKVDIEKIINQTYETTKLVSDAIKSLRNYVDFMAENSSQSSQFTSTQDTLSTYEGTASGHLDNLLSTKTDIKNYKDAFIDTDLDIKSSLLLIKQKESTLKDARNKLEDYYIRAPFDGIITKIDGKVGEVYSLGSFVVRMMNVGTFQIESYVPEVNIALLKLGDKARVALDAYGGNTLFDAEVVFIDPAETIKDGVSTYKIKLQFKENDERIKSGMTANVLVTVFDKPNVIVVPDGVVFDKNGKKFVQIKENNKILDREVVLGSVSSLGQTEVVSGLFDGDMIVLNPKVN